VRTPTDMPRRRRGSGRGRIVLIVGALVLFVLFMSLRGLAGFYTDYLWFDSLDLTDVWSGILWSKVALGAIFTGIFFALCFVSLTIADRVAPAFRPSGPEDELLKRYHQAIGRRAGLVRAAVSLLFGLIAGVGVSAQWNEWILFRNGGDFGIDDATFGTDVGFYVFKLPFYSAVVDWLFASTVIILLITVVAHYLNGGIRLQAPFQRVTPQVKAHLSVLLALLALVKAVDYWLQRYELTFSTRGAVDGATYTDVNAQLPAIYLLLLISLLSCGLFIANIWRRGWVLPVVAVGLWGFVSIVVGIAYPAFIQRFQVEPEESTQEAPYIDNNILATRQALGMNEVEVRPFEYSTDPSDARAAIQDDPGNVRNIRLLDPKVVTPTYQADQALRGFYQFNDLDVDRYPIRTPTGDIADTQVVLSNRDLNLEGIPQQSWEGRHLAYTHGYGLALSPANATTPQGRPDYLIKDIPVSVDEERIEVPVDQPQVYFSENLSGYSIVNTTRDEVDFVDPSGATVPFRYDGSGGVPLDSFARRAAFAARFGDWNIFISDFVTEDSRIMYVRDVRERVEAVAPFLSFDGDPYPVVTQGGEIVYIVDGYTTSDDYPNAQRVDNSGISADSGLNRSFNYVRNSIKAVVDAYDGTVKLYVIDPDDPIAAAYQKAFPDLMVDGDQLPQDLRDHLRYPEDLFRVQTNMWGRYHITDSSSFYEQTNAWAVAQNPGVDVSSGAAPAPTTTLATGQVLRARQARIEPYYLLMTPPGDTEESFLMLRSYVPYSDDDSRANLSAFMIGKSDADQYGKLVVYEMPSDESIAGPNIVASQIAANEEVSQRITLLDQQGSRVQFGDLILVPLGDTLLYVRPLYVTAQGQTPVPELKNVIVVFGQTVVMRPTLREALQELFDITPETFEQQTGVVVTPGGEPGGTDGTSTSSTSTTTTAPGTPPVTGEPGQQLTVDQLLTLADDLFAEADVALRTGDLATYQRNIDEAADLVSRARQQLEAEAETTAGAEPTGEA
jgi:uncharacterized membrane protein (UPF0182 family)